MGIFKKRVPDVVDLTKLQEKGILQRSRALAREKEGSINNDVVDLSVMMKNKTTSESNSPVSGGFDFLTSLANAGNENSPNINKGVENNPVDFQGIKNKIEDIEYKLERFIERISKIESKLSELS